MLASTDIAFRR